MPHVSSPPAVQRSIVRRLTILYSTALVLVGAIIITGTVIRVTVFETLLTNDVEAMHLATEEGEFSQRLSKDALALSVTPEAAPLGASIADLRTILSELQASYAVLHGSGDTPRLKGWDTGRVGPLFDTAQPHLQALVAAATRFLAAATASSTSSVPASGASLDPDVRTTLVEGLRFEEAIERVARSYQVDSATIQGLEATLDRTRLGLVLFALVVAGLLVFRPATRQVGRSIEELARAVEQQRELAALKDQFIIDANHELRTPIMALYNNVELLAVAERRDDPALRADLIRQALASGDGLLRLLGSVLDAGALGVRAPRIEPKNVPLKALVHTVLETFDPHEIGELGLPSEVYRSRAVTVEIPEGLAVWADEGRLRQVLINLIANALKYSGPGTPIAISATEVPVARPHGRMGRRGKTDAPDVARLVRVNVSDRGLGVPPRDAPKLFNRFVRLPRDIAGPVRGTGVGLYLCRTYVEAMGGRIWVESSGVPGEGSTFSFTLPTTSAGVAGHA